jgi:hypothetical protein
LRIARVVVPLRICSMLSLEMLSSPLVPVLPLTLPPLHKRLIHKHVMYSIIDSRLRQAPLAGDDLLLTAETRRAQRKEENSPELCASVVGKLADQHACRPMWFVTNLSGVSGPAHLARIPNWTLAFSFVVTASAVFRAKKATEVATTIPASQGGLTAVRKIWGIQTSPMSSSDVSVQRARQQAL